MKELFLISKLFRISLKVYFKINCTQMSTKFRKSLGGGEHAQNWIMKFFDWVPVPNTGK